MTSYRLISDIHSEFWPEYPKKAVRIVDQLLPPLPEDAETVLLLAGDIGSHRRRNVYAAVVGRLCDRFKLRREHFVRQSRVDRLRQPSLRCSC